MLGDDYAVEGGDLGPHVAVGDMVLFSKYSGTEFSVSEEAGFRILDENEILCTFIAKEGSDVNLALVEGEV